MWPGAATTMRYADPAAGIGFARMLADAIRHAEHRYVQHAREHGMTWQQAGQALGLTQAAEQRGARLAEVAFEYATGAEHAQPFETLTFGWHCYSCGHYISDHGPYEPHPADNEHGHTSGCERLAAAIAEHDARWAGE